MLFARKYRREMGLLKEGIVVDGFRVESVSVMHIGVDRGVYEYPTEMVVEGRGNAERVCAL